MGKASASKPLPPEVVAPRVGEKDFQQLEKLAADKFAAAFKGIVSTDAVRDHDGDDF